MKLFLIPFAIACFCIAASYSEESVSEEPFSEAMLETFKNLDPSVLEFLPINRAGDNTHWCCNNDQPIGHISKTKVKPISTTDMFEVVTGYTCCGFICANRCPLYSPRYKKVMTYMVETYEVPDEKACFDQHIKCCNGYIEIASNCFTVDEAIKIQKELGVTIPNTKAKRF